MTTVPGNVIANLHVDDMRNMSIDGTRRHLSAKCLEAADFGGCVFDSMPCEHARNLKHEGFDIHLLGCQHHHQQLTPEEAAKCTFKPA